MNWELELWHFVNNSGIDGDVIKDISTSDKGFLACCVKEKHMKEKHATS